MKAYLHYFKLRLITNLQYRIPAIAGILTQIFFGLTFIMIYLAFYESNNNPPPMPWDELVTYLWLQQAFYSLIYPREKDQELLRMIKNGDISYELIRPQNFFLKFYTKMIAKKVTYCALRVLPIFIVAFLLPKPFKMSPPKNLTCFLIFIASLILSCLLISALTVIIHILTIYTIDSRGTMTVYSTILEVFMGQIIPIPFFPDKLKKLANILPFRYISDFPFRIYSNNISINNGLHLLLGSSIWIVITIIIGLLLSKHTLKKAVIQGG